MDIGIFFTASLWLIILWLLFTLWLIARSVRHSGSRAPKPVIVAGPKPRTTTATGVAPELRNVIRNVRYPING